MIEIAMGTVNVGEKVEFICEHSVAKPFPFGPAAGKPRILLMIQRAEYMLKGLLRGLKQRRQNMISGIPDGNNTGTSERRKQPKSS